MASSMSELRTHSHLQLFRRNGRDAHEAHEVLDGLQIGLPNRSPFERLRRGSGRYSVFCILTAFGRLNRIRSKENRNEENIGNQESQFREEALKVLEFSPRITLEKRTCREKD